MSKLVILAASFVLCTSDAGAEQLAIACSGHQTQKFKNPASEKQGDTSRTYVIDESRKDVSFWNETFGRSVSLCDQRPKCEFDFSPHMIMLTYVAPNGDSEHAMINRREGTIWYFSASTILNYEFKGQCERAAMPKADDQKNKF